MLRKPSPLDNGAMSMPETTVKEKQLRRDLRILGRFIGIYCNDQHSSLAREPARMKTHDVAGITGKELVLCEGCLRLLTHAWTKRTHCPMDPKPMCKHCPKHCYRPDYRKQIQEVMRHSGMKMVLGGRLDYLLHYLF
jgi:Nitrous oxide-stimulated promoter